MVKGKNMNRMFNIVKKSVHPCSPDHANQPRIQGNKHARHIMFFLCATRSCPIEIRGRFAVGKNLTQVQFLVNQKWGKGFRTI